MSERVPPAEPPPTLPPPKPSDALRSVLPAWSTGMFGGAMVAVILATVSAKVPTATSPSRVFHFGDVKEDHEIGHRECPECWKGYPVACEEEGCQGLVHGQFGDENWDGDYWLFTTCDVCGESL